MCKSTTYEKHKVAVTGIGSICSIGNNCDTILESLKTGRTGIGNSEFFHNSLSSIKVAAEIKNFDLSDFFNENQVDEELIKRIRKILKKQSTLCHETIIASTIQAMRMAKIKNDSFETYEGKVGIIVAGSNLSQSQQVAIYDRNRDSIEYISPQYAVRFFDTNFIGMLSDCFRIKGEGLTTGGASASGNVALVQAYRMIAYGMLDICIVIGPAADFSPYELQSFKNLGLFGETFNDSPKRACRPFDCGHEGFVIGQGSGAIILEAEEKAVKRNADILAHILGGSIKLDANCLADARVEGEYCSMEQALFDAGVNTDAIDYINAHGTSTPLGDEVELTAIKKLFGSKAKDIFVNSSKSLLGHCIYSAGILEAIVCILQIQNGFVHPNLNLDHPISMSEGIGLVGATSINCNINTALSNSFGFGGINSTVVMGK